MIRALCTLGPIGHMRPGPGTWGSAAAVLMAWGLHVLGGFWLVLAATLAVTALGWWAVAQATRGSTDKDPSEIIIDEVAGQWIALWPVSLGAQMAGAGFWDLWPGVVTAFVAFRLFDILKPGPVGWADRQTGAFGVMADDMIAGWMAALVVAVLAFLAHLPQVMG
ncbi:phosphatidylglycerophosphatase A family protein [Roseicyclus mahoneyensis]|uniref:Phosphatidylglycerophosphatase A n=1 Tax=Roseicyclus mahoneyensis TaxID=164332 RepID=A0A316GPX1_9RHOB|nr:phosphatidylglycerophosphatase A [Roseicyclus mahoneyensis]PWK62769.1 phosphatidylglycerophosphatase A [Roseicyclus mahoneyensis]